MKIYAVVKVTLLPSALPPVLRIEGAKSQNMTVLVDTGKTAKSVKDFERIISSDEYENGTYIPIPEEIQPRTVKAKPKQFKLELVGNEQ